MTNNTTNTQKLIAEFLTQGGYASGIDAEALHREAALVEAAPDLLAALGAIKSILGDAFADEECDVKGQLGGYIFGDVMQDAFHAAKTAIAKAKG